MTSITVAVSGLCAIGGASEGENGEQRDMERREKERAEQCTLSKPQE